MTGVNLWAQGVPGHAEASAPQSSRDQKIERKSHQATTGDTIVLLAARREAVAAPDPVPVEIANDTANKAAEIASLEQGICDKQKRIALLMRLFVQDERAFVNDPINSNADAASTMRRRDEQEELHGETAELARLKARLREITAARAAAFTVSDR